MKLTSHAEVIKNELAKWLGVYKNRLGRKVEKKDEKSEQLMERNMEIKKMQCLNMWEESLSQLEFKFSFQIEGYILNFRCCFLS